MGSQFSYLYKKVLRTSRALLKGNWERKAFYLSNDFPGEVEERSEGVWLSKLNVVVPKNKFQFILESYPISRLFVDHADVKFELTDNNFFVYWNDLKLNPTTAEEIFIIQEIYACGTYNYQSNGSHVAIDIGMNVAFASLFFAAKKNVKQVYSFEPFEPTYKQARVNIGNNPSLATKIESAHYGLNDQEQTLEVDYTYESKGQVGIYGTDLIRSDVRQSEKIKIELKPVANTLREIFNRHADDRFIFKVDCEGAEYGIFESLDQHQLLDRVDVIFIEWHERGPQMLVDILIKNNFTVFYQQAAGIKVGMIYAAR